MYGCRSAFFVLFSAFLSFRFIILFVSIMEKKVTNKKHGIKVTKRDVVLSTNYIVSCRDFGSDLVFNTKLEAINFITSVIDKDPHYNRDSFSLFSINKLKF